VSMPQLTSTRALRCVIEVTRLTRSGGDLETRLGQLADAIADLLGYGRVTVAVYRRAWDDFRVAAVGGSEGSRNGLVGETRARSEYDELLTSSVERRGAYTLSDGDALVVPLADREGEPLGMLSVHAPASPRRPTDKELDLLVTVAEHVALAIESVGERTSAAAHRAALEQLLEVSSRLGETMNVDALLHAVCQAIRGALGFEKVSIELLGTERELFRPRASAGWGALGPVRSDLTRTALMSLLDGEYEIEGCYLMPIEASQGRLGERQPSFVSIRNGTGPHAWNRHWLIVPLHDRDEQLKGFIWADDPTDRLLPSRERLHALRLFADQTITALEAATRFEDMQFLADHDPLTRLGNRRAFVRRLEAEAARAARYGESFALMLCDLDGFKELNDRCGHLAGDEQLVDFALRLGASIRREDGAYRVGGDEFALILVEAGVLDARRVANRVSAGSGELSASFGVAVYETGLTPEELFRRADEAMYSAKRSGHRVNVA
jgi:diguanylate cyclase (GGDEF)-like protein